MPDGMNLTNARQAMINRYPATTQDGLSNIMSIGADVVPENDHAVLNYNGSQPDLDYTHIYGWNRGAVPIEGLYTRDQYGREFRIENRALGAPYELPTYGPFRTNVVNAYLMDVTQPYQQMLAPMWRESDHLLANFMNQQMPQLMATRRAAVRSGGVPSPAPAQQTQGTVGVTTKPATTGTVQATVSPINEVTGAVTPTLLPASNKPALSPVVPVYEEYPNEVASPQAYGMDQETYDILGQHLDDPVIYNWLMYAHNIPQIMEHYYALRQANPEQAKQLYPYLAQYLQ